MFVHGKFKRSIACSLLFGLTFIGNATAVTKRNFDFIVGIDGDFKAAMSAAASKANSSKRFLMFFPDGEYDIGSLTGDSNQMTTFPTSYVSFIGQSADKTVIYNKSINEGISISATIQFKASDIYMQDLSLYNKAVYGDESQYNTTGRHDALMTVGDKFIYKNVKLLSTQDTYYTKLGSSGLGRSYWEGGEIHGTTDFICGDGDVFFQGVRLLEMKKSAMTAAATTSTWGYVFNQCTIDALNSTINGNYTLGRSWKSAKTVFLNTTMNAQPTAAGWGDPMNSVPQVFAEYNSMDGNGKAINLSNRRTSYTKDDVTVTLNPELSATEAAKYTVANVLGGSDNWDPASLTAQVSAPTIEQNANTITWASDDNALCWVVFVDGKYKANVTTNSYDASSIATGAKITVRAANSMGGLGESSNAITMQDANLNYFSVNATAGIGGSIAQNPEGSKLAEGTKVTFTATPVTGWQFAGWTGANAAEAGTNETWTATISKDVEISANFEPTDKSTYQAESGSLENAIYEDKNAGFAGTGYVNFSAGTSSVKIPIYADVSGEYSVTLTFANGSSDTRSLAISSESNDNNSVNVDCSATGAWTTYESTVVKISIPAGASYLTLSTVNGNDGPNLDQIAIEITDTTTTAIQARFESKQEPRNSRYLIYGIDGRQVRSGYGTPDTHGLPQGSYRIRFR